MNKIKKEDIQIILSTSSSIVRAIHIPTGIEVECQRGETYKKSRDLIIKKLKNKIDDSKVTS